MVIAAPSDENEARLLLSTCYHYPGPAAIRYPRGSGRGAAIAKDLATVDLGKAVLRRKGQGVAILVFGTRLPAALEAAERLDLTVVDMRFVKPLDVDMVTEMAGSHGALVTIEEGSIMGGAGSAVTEALNASGVVCPVMQLGLPDVFVDHGDQGKLLAGLGLDAAGIEQSIRERFAGLIKPV